MDKATKKALSKRRVHKKRRHRLRLDGSRPKVARTVNAGLKYARNLNRKKRKGKM